MTQNGHYLLVDAGNTRIKVAHYQDERLISLQSVATTDFTGFSSLLDGIPYSNAILSSVLSVEDTEKLRSKMQNCVLLREARLPIEIQYLSPQTLGADRIANAVAIAHLAKGAALSIDVGTCIKFDVVDENHRYLGGSISPGIALRYRSLHDYTAALPLLSALEPQSLIGQDTNSSLQSGVLNGIQGEINHFITTYLKLYPDLTIFVTGGDAAHFDYSVKKGIFADENLTLLGLLLILKANAT